MAQHKLVCLNCCKAFSREADRHEAQLQSLKCPECGKNGFVYTHRFRPPAKLNRVGWQVVKFLFEHGFVYQHIYKKSDAGAAANQTENYAEHPTTMHQAREFVEEYSSQARDVNKQKVSST